ncbi:MAG: hypothetical protein GY711_14820 [bacterium]|nr:hypothetical protein [bacterium]
MFNRITRLLVALAATVSFAAAQTPGSFDCPGCSLFKPDQEFSYQEGDQDCDIFLEIKIFGSSGACERSSIAAPCLPDRPCKIYVHLYGSTLCDGTTIAFFVDTTFGGAWNLDLSPEPTELWRSGEVDLPCDTRFDLSLIATDPHGGQARADRSVECTRCTNN